MTLIERSPASTPDVLAPELEEPYRRLLRVLRAGQGMFTLIPVESNLTEDERQRLLNRLRQDLIEEGLSLREVELTYNDWDPMEALEKELGQKPPESLVVVLSGLERTPTGRLSDNGIARPPAFLRLNQARELLEQCHPVPTIVWCEPYTYGTLRRHAADFFDHFTGLVRFVLPRSSTPEESEKKPPVLAALELDYWWKSRKGNGSAAAVRFYEQRLEDRALEDTERVRGLLGLAEALVDRREIEGIRALERAVESALKARALLGSETDLEAWSRTHLLLARAQVEIGLMDGALPAAREAAKSYARLAQIVHNRGAFPMVAFVASLGILALVLDAMDRQEEAVEVITTAVGLSRDLSQQMSDVFLPLLADNLKGLSVFLADLDRRTEALSAIEEAVEIYRNLSKVDPARSKPRLASSLDVLSSRFAELHRREEALSTVEEAVEIYRDLSQHRPEEFLPLLATSLLNLSFRLAERPHCKRAALAAAQESVKIHRELLPRDPDTFQPALAKSLFASHLWLRHSRRKAAATESLEAITEALDLLEPFLRRQPATYAPLMKWVFQNYKRAAKSCDISPDEGRLRAIGELLETVDSDGSARA